MQGQLVLVGGTTTALASGAIATVDRINGFQVSFSAPPLPFGARSLPCVLSDSIHLYLLSSMDSAEVEHNDAWLSSDAGSSWTVLPVRAWSARSAAACTVDGSSLIIAGGADTWISRTGGLTWIQINASTSYQPRALASLVVQGQSIVMLAGNSVATPHNDVFRLSGMDTTAASTSSTGGAGATTASNTGL